MHYKFRITNVDTPVRMLKLVPKSQVKRAAEQALVERILKDAGAPAVPTKPKDSADQMDTYHLIELILKGATTGNKRACCAPIVNH